MDKAAQLLGLPYPGGPYIEKAANNFFQESLSKGMIKEDIEKENPFPEILKDQPKDEFDFSFSGIKTALTYLLRNNKKQFSVPELSYHFQTRLIQLILRNTKKVLLRYDIANLILAGGVAANQTLRKALIREAVKLKVRLIYPEIQYCTNNAAMVASLGFLYFKNKDWPENTYCIFLRRPILAQAFSMTRGTTKYPPSNLGAILRISSRATFSGS